jgi:hypothetical protein
MNSDKARAKDSHEATKITKNMRVPSNRRGTIFGKPSPIGASICALPATLVLFSIQLFFVPFVASWLSSDLAFNK